LKPIVTNDGVATAESSSMPGSVPLQLGSVFLSNQTFPAIPHLISHPSALPSQRLRYR
jgi:hypothetical protein